MINSVTEAAAARESTALAGLDKDAFLKLLVAQMRYQNPMDPLDGQEYLAQAAQFAGIERLQELAEAQADMIAYQRVLLSTALVGKEVVGIDQLAEQVSGTVDAVRFSGGSPVLVVDGAEVPLDAVEEVSVPQTPTTP